MSIPSSSAFLIGFLLCLTPACLVACQGRALATADTSSAWESQRADIGRSVSLNPKIEIRSITLKRRNWENHGTDSQIEEDGSYYVFAVYLGKREKIRQGTVAEEQLREFASILEEAKFEDLKDEYTEPFETEFSWWGYELTIETGQWTKSSRFHSEDKTVPESLKRLVDKVMSLTK